MSEYVNGVIRPISSISGQRKNNVNVHDFNLVMKEAANR